MNYKTKLFDCSENTWANACVGDNGSPGYWEYARGFSKAANLLLDFALEHSDPIDIDTLVYPIFFNMRHSIELRIKSAIGMLISMAKFRGVNYSIDLVKSHDIGRLWMCFKDEALKVDSRYSDLIGSLDDYIFDLNLVDSTGQVFRYPYSNDDVKHLTEVSIINFVSLSESFRIIEEKFDQLYELNNYLINECSQGTHTKRLSRSDIKDISLIVPAFGQWRTESFKEKKKVILHRYEISSREFSRALDFIKNNYEFSRNVEIEIGLKGVSDSSLLFFVKKWVELKRESFCAGGRVEGGIVKMSPEVMKSTLVFKDQLYGFLSEILTAEFLAGIDALFYFSKDLDFSERYVKVYELSLAEMQSEFRRSNERAALDNIAGKFNLVNGMFKSLDFLGKGSLKEKIILESGVSADGYVRGS